MTAIGIRAIYKYRVHDFNGDLIPRETAVEIIGETARSYRVRYLGFGPRNAPPGHETFVAKRSLQIPGVTPLPRRRPINLRNPYKD